MSRTPIDLSRDLPVRAAPLAERALAGVFGGALPCSTEGLICGFGLGCCAGLACRSVTVFGLTVSRCVQP